MQTFHLEIVSPEGVSFTGDVREVVLPTTSGEIAVLPGHAPLFTRLAEGEAIVKNDKKTTSIAILGGFVEVGKTQVTVLSDYAVEADTIQEAKVQEAKKRAEDILAGKAANEDFAMAEKDLQKAIFSLRIAEKMRKRNRS